MERVLLYSLHFGTLLSVKKSTPEGNTSNFYIGGWDNQPVELAKKVTTGEVTSFNGRTGDVLPESGDYNSEIISYDNTRTKMKANTVQEAIDEIFARMYGDFKVRVKCYETESTTPISGVLVNGITTDVGGPVYADSNGIAEGYVIGEDSGSHNVIVTVQISSDYIDLTGQTSQTISVQKGVIKETTLYATRLAENSIIQITTSKQIMVTSGRDNASSREFPVHLIGGGQGGGIGYKTGGGAKSGLGGKRGKSYVGIATLTPNVFYPVVIGAGGNGAAAKTGNWSYKIDGKNGGNTTFAGLSSESGTTEDNVGTAGFAGVESFTPAVAPPDSPIYPFNDSLQAAVAGGQGGIGSVRYEGIGRGHTASEVQGSNPYGGEPSGSYNGSGGDATGPAGGGAGGGMNTTGSNNSGIAKAGGKGGNGLFLIKV